MNVVFPIKTYFLFSKQEMTSWVGNFIYTYILLDRNADWRELIAKFPSLLDKHIYQAFKIDIEDKFKEKLTLQPLTDIHLHSQRNQEMEPNGDFNNVILMGSLAILFLIIACINYINLSTARSGQRGKEVGLRKVVGARRSQLIGQFFGESMLLTVAASFIAVLSAWLALPYFNEMVERPIRLDPFSNLSLSVGLLILVTVVGLFAGSFPAIMISGFKPIAALRGTFSLSPKGLKLRNLLVLTQFAITIIILAFTFIAKDQIRYMLNKNAGYDKEQIITIKVQDENIKGSVESIKTELLRYPGIVKAAASYRLPNNIDEHQGYTPPGSTIDRKFMIYYNFVDYDFVDLYGIEIVEGRNFSRAFPSDANGAYLVNEAAVKSAGWDNPVGVEFSSYKRKPGKIVGVMKDFHIRPMHFPIEPVYMQLSPPGEWISFLSVKIKPSNIPETIKHIEQFMKKFSPKYPFDYKFFDEVFAAQYGNEKKMVTLFSAFAVLATIVACLGLFGLATFAAERRMKEISVRKVLGASAPDIFVLLSKEFLRWVALANIIAWPVAYYFTRQWLNDFAFRVDIVWWMFAFPGAIALLIALATVSGQAIKSAYRNPVESLREE
jgi:putative ABC transport system permease protein